jgi:hypothetical protein
MKRLSLILALVVAALPLSAGQWTSDPFYLRQVTKMNKAACLAEFLPIGCTQSALRDAFCQRTTGHVAPCPGTGAVRIYTGPDDMIDRLVADEYKTKIKTEQRQEDVAAGCAVWNAMTQAQQDATCAAMTPAQAPGCVVCP